MIKAIALAALIAGAISLIHSGVMSTTLVIIIVVLILALFIR